MVSIPILIASNIILPVRTRIYFWYLLTRIQFLGVVKFFEFLIEKLSSPSPSEPVKAMDTSGIILVAGATGGVGRRVVNILQKKGLPVRVLVFLLLPYNVFVRHA